MTSLLTQTRNPRHRSRGFTLIELLVAMTLAAILLALAMPSFSALVARNRLSMQTNEFVAALNLARMEALRRASGVSVSNSDGTTGSFTAGWSVFPDSNNDGVKLAGDAEIRSAQALAGTTTIVRAKLSGTAYVADDGADKSYVSFSSRGTRTVAGSTFFKVCDSANASLQGRVVKVSTTGVISLASTTATCP